MPLSNGKDLEKHGLSFYRNAIKLKIEDNESYGVFWQPLEKYMRNFTNIYISVDGVYNNINLNTLNTTNGKYLIDNYNLVRLPSLKTILDIKHLNQKSKVTSASLIGNPDFGNNNLISPLPATLLEVEAIKNLLANNQVSVSQYTGQKATALAVRSIADTDIIHIATHGFFIPDTQMQNASWNLLNKSYEGPLFRSGLMFAGAAEAYESGQFEPLNKNVLSAYEAISLNLENTKLVVLSACETGSGEVVNGEGIYGLQRSFQVAGAEATVMSLWKVDDQATQELMVELYREYTVSGNISSSFRSAQLTLREKYSQPYYWGAFVLTQN